MVLFSRRLARIKFEGPGFPHGQAGQKNAICIERVIVIRSAKEANS